MVFLIDNSFNIGEAMYKLIYMSLMFLFSVDAVAQNQDTPAAVKSILQNGQGPGLRVISKSELTDEQLEFFSKNQRTEKKGYTQVNVAPEYLNQLSDPYLTQELSATRGDHEFSFMGFTLLGRIKENPLRRTLIFGSKEDVSATLVAWKFKEDGAKLVLLKENFNQKVSNSPAIATLARAKDNSSVLWNIMWIHEDISYELSVGDVLDSGGVPKYTIEQIVKESEKLLPTVARDFSTSIR